jgi:putative endonuclease
VAGTARDRGGRHELGRRAEAAVADYLIAQGFAVVGRNVRVGRLEIDILARRGGLAVAVEVRTRGAGSFEGAFESITPGKRKRTLLAVERLWHERLAAVRSIERVRIDAAAVTFTAGRTFVEYAAGVISGG